ncbi:hypothetical protein NA78x_000406 [Anatilimnocola sp. NA78]|uniref:hypothetical protein n=1 Tax=Anatilimnocola sp. NA78 TaxID=3415683 RepID=UPI003CE46942
MALAAFLMVWPPLRIGQRIPIVLLLVFAGLALHYIAIVPIAYPFIFAEEYFVPLGTVLVIGSAFYVLQRFWQVKLICQDKPTAGLAIPPQRYAWTITDLLLWTFVSGLMLVIARRSMILTDVSGMSDPWDSIEFAITADTEFLLPRVPVLLLAWIWYGLMWTTLTYSLLVNRPWTSWLSMKVCLLFVALSIGELAISSLMTLFDMPWPFLPLGMYPCVMFAKDLQISYERNDPHFPTYREVGDICAILLVRASIWTLSLVMLRNAGYRLVKRS